MLTIFCLKIKTISVRMYLLIRGSGRICQYSLVHPLEIRKYFRSRRHSKQDFLRRETFIASEGDAAMNLDERNRNKKRLLGIGLPQKHYTWDRRLTLLFQLNTEHPTTILQEQLQMGKVQWSPSRNIGIFETPRILSWSAIFGTHITVKMGSFFAFSSFQVTKVIFGNFSWK